MFTQADPPRHFAKFASFCSPARLVLLWLLAAGICPRTALQAEVFYWDADAGAGTGGTGIWDNSSNLWRPGSPSVSPTFWPGNGGNNDAYLHGSQGTLNLGSSIRVNDLFIAPTSGFSYSITGSHVLSLIGSEVSQIDVAASASLTIRSQLAGTAGLLKTGLGRLAIDNFANNLTGPVLVNAGTLQIGSTTNNASTAALRSSPVHLSSGANLTIDGGGSSMRIGTLTGEGTVTAIGKTLYVANLGAADYTQTSSANTYYASGPVFSGTMNAGALNISGAGGTQVALPGGSRFSMMTLNGDLREVRASITVNSGAGLTLTGTGAATRGITNASSVTLRGGALVMDAFAGNPSGGRRIQTDAPITLLGGTLVVVGSANTTTNAVAGASRLYSGASTIAVIQSGSSQTSLSLGILDRNTTTHRSTLDFRAEGGTLGAPGNNPRITAGGLLNGTQEPWMTVNGSTYATYDSTNGIRAATLTALAAAPTGSGSATTYYDLSGHSELGAASFSAKGVRILPGIDGASLELKGAGDLATGGILLAGSRDFTIAASGTGGLRHTAPRYIGVAEAGTTLTISAPFRSPGQDIVKYGHGVLELTADHSASLNSGLTNFVVNAGTLRASVGPNGSLPSNGNAALTLRGGILEIANGNNGSGSDADFRFNLGTSGGGVNWSTAAAIDDGSGGFAAIRQNASVNIGGLATPSTLQWAASHFVGNGQALLLNSTTADRRITLLNNIALNDGAAANDYFAREFRIADNPLSGADVARISGSLTGGASADFLKTGAGTLEITGNNTFSGNTIVQEGVLQLGASDGPGAGAAGALSGTAKIILKSHITNTDGTLTANNRGTLLLGGDAGVTDRIGDHTQLVLEGGVFNANGRSETLGALTLLHVDSILDLGNLADGLSAQVLRFAASNEIAWSGKLQIWNWSGSFSGGGTDQLYFGLGLDDLRPDQLAAISFFSDDGQTFLGLATQISTGEVIPVIPEPGTVFHSLALIVVIGATHRWRFRRG